MPTNANYEVPNQDEAIVDGIAINPQGALSGQALIYDPGTNSFIPGSSSGNLNGAFTAGQIAFAVGPGTTYSLQGNSNFIWDNTDGYLGIGTSSPAYKLHIIGDGYFTSNIIINGSSAAVSPSGAGALRFNSSSNHFEFSENGGSWTQFGASLAIGAAVTGSINKSILFVNSSNQLAQDNSNFNYDNNTHKLTVGGHISVDGYTIDMSGGAVSGQALVYNGISFIPTNQSGGGISGTLTSGRVPYASGASTLSDTSNFIWDNSNKILTITTITGNTGITLTDSTRNIAMAVTSTAGQIGTTSNHKLEFFTNNSAAQMTLSTAGYLGIGAVPSYQLHIVGDGYLTGRQIINGSSASVSPSGMGAIRFNSGTNHLEFSENGGSWTQFGSGAGTVSSVSNNDNTLTITPTTGAVVASLNLGNANTWTATQTFHNIVPATTNTYSLGSSSAKWQDGYFAGKLNLDGYNLDLSSGATTNQVLQYNGTSFVAATISTTGISNTIFPSLVDMAQAAKTSGESTLCTLGNGTGNAAGQNAGVKFVMTTDATCTGIRFYWNPNTSRTVRCNIWKVSNTTSQGSVDVSTSGSGTYTGTFSSPISLSKGVTYIASCWDTSGNDYTFVTGPLVYPNSTNSQTPGLCGGEYMIWVAWDNWSASSNAFPSSNANTERYPVEPVFTVP